MTILTIADAIQIVRKNLDEVGLNDSQMFGENTDNAQLDSVITDTLPEAINSINRNAPTEMLEGLKEVFEVRTEGSPSQNSELTISNQVGVFTISNGDVLRLLFCKASDSEIVVSAIEEMSAIGRQQANQYVRGTFDKPVLVRTQADHNKFKYYSFKDDTTTPQIKATYIPVCYLKSGALYVTETQTQKEGYYVSPLVKDSILNQLTAMVLSIYGETDRAGLFQSRV